jgi:hypothetical protein
MMEAVSTSETLANFTVPHGVTTQKTAIFMVGGGGATVLVCVSVGARGTQLNSQVLPSVVVQARPDG